MRPFLRPDPDSGEIRDHRDLEAVVRALVSRTARNIDERTLGTLRIPSGAVSVADPLNHLHKQSLVRRAPIGEHDVSTVHDSDASTLAALVVRFAEGDITAVERAVVSWPFADERVFSLASGCCAVFDSDPVAKLAPPKLEALTAMIASATRDAPAAVVSPPRARSWNIVVCRAPKQTDGYYSTHWALGRSGPLALVVDFAALE